MFISLYPASSAFPALGQSTTLQRRCWAFFISKSRVCQNLLRVSCSLNSSLLSSGSGQRREGSLYTEKTGRSVFTLIRALHQGDQRQLECVLLRAAIGRKLWGVRHRTGSCVPLLSGLIPSSKSVRKYANKVLQPDILKITLPCAQCHGLILYQLGIAFGRKS